MKRIIILLVFGLFFYSCTTKPKLPSQDTIISKMNDMSNLGTIEYSLTKIVQVDDKLFDASIKHDLQHIKRQFIKNMYVSQLG
jgi:hypothetical protein